MTLRRKTLLIIGLTLAVLFGLLYLALSTILLDGFSRVEEQDTQANVRRVEEALGKELDGLSATAGDWAFWDDTHAFVRGANRDYVTQNLGDAALFNLDVNLMVFVNSAGVVVYAKGLELPAGRAVAVPAGFSAYLAGHPALLAGTGADSLVSGIVLLPEGPLLIAARPILTSARTGPPAGTLILGRYLDDYRVNLLAERTHYDLAVYRLDGPALPPGGEAAVAALQQDAGPYVRPLSPDSVAGYSLLPGVDGRPALLLQVVSPRDVFNEGQRSLRYLIFSLLALGLVSLGLTLLLLERLVLARLAQLTAGVDRIGASGDLSHRLALPGRDELAGLAAAINHMLQALQDALTREKQLKSEIQALRIEIDQARRQKQVEEIVESDFFRDLQAKSAEFRRRHKAKGGEDRG